MALRHRCFLALGLLMAAALSSVEALRPALVPRRAVPTASSPSSPAADVSRRAALAGLVGLTAPSMARAVDSKDKKTLDEETARKYKAIYAAKSRMTDPKQQESYMQQVCKSGILGPSILAWALCK